MTTPNFYVRDIPIVGDAILAPMSGYSDLPFRSITRELGSAMSYTEFVPAPGLLKEIETLYRKLLYTEAERPIVFQIYGANVKELVDAALRIEQLGPDIIDLNMGCWAPKVAENGSGAGLLRDPQKIGQIFRELNKALSIPVTGKIRLGWDSDSLNYLDVCKILEDNGAALIAVHGRTKHQAYRGKANWDAIAEIKQAVSVPVIGNGDVKNPTDIQRMKDHTGVDGVMIARAAIGNPWIFQHKEREDITYEARADMLRKHMQLSIDYYGEDTGFRLFKRHAVKYVYGTHGASRMREALCDVQTPADVHDLIARYQAKQLTKVSV